MDNNSPRNVIPKRVFLCTVHEFSCDSNFSELVNGLLGLSRFNPISIQQNKVYIKLVYDYNYEIGGKQS